MLCFHPMGIVLFGGSIVEKLRTSMSWKLHGRAFRIPLGILSCPRVLPLNIFWRHLSYVQFKCMMLTVEGVRRRLFQSGYTSMAL